MSNFAAALVGLRISDFSRRKGETCIDRLNDVRAPTKAMCSSSYDFHFLYDRMCYISALERRRF